MRDALKDLADQFWPGDAVGDGAVGVYVPAVGGVAVHKAREAVVPHDADQSVCTSELADRVHAVDGQAVIAVDACREDHGRLERIALFARQAMIVAGRVHVETTVDQVVDVCFLWCKL